LHGDDTDEALAAERLSAARMAGGLLIFGHEHPAMVIGDGVAHSARVPCFLTAPGALVLPAFSGWAAGSNVRHDEYLSPYTRAAAPKKAVAILAGKLLPMAV
jgi:metallophosphoesterase superfamily enzyme